MFGQGVRDAMSCLAVVIFS